MEELKNKMLNKKIWTVIGATPNPEKFGYKIYQRLKEKGYEVYPLNPKYDKINQDKCYKNIAELPVKPDCVNIVVPPKVSKKAIEEIAQNDIQYIWFQPGSFDEETLQIAKEKELHAVYNSCVLIELKKK